MFNFTHWISNYEITICLYAVTENEQTMYWLPGSIYYEILYFGFKCLLEINLHEICYQPKIYFI